MNSECSVCIEIVRSNETQKPFVTRCGHLFHENCIKNCLKNNYGKCPQCNQPIVSTQLIRLFINEPEHSIRAKDEMIGQLKNQLVELHEKAQLQYDLIGALNRQIVLEKELSQKEKKSQSRRSETLSGPIASQRFPIISQSSLQPSYDFGIRNDKTVKSKFAFAGINSTETLGACGVSGLGNNEPGESKSTFADKNSTETLGAFGVSGIGSVHSGESKFIFGDKNSSEILGACGLSATLTSNNLKFSTAQNRFSNIFNFGSAAASSNSNQMSCDFTSNDSSNANSTFTFDEGKKGIGSEAAAKIPTESSGQHVNIFVPATSGAVSKPFLRARSPATINRLTDSGSRRFSPGKMFSSYRNIRECSPIDASTVSSSSNLSNRMFQTNEEQLRPGRSFLPFTFGDNVLAPNNNLVRDTSISVKSENSSGVGAQLEKNPPEKENS